MSQQTIYVALLNEGVDVWRPVLTERRPDGTYRLPPEQPDDETWQFPPGSLVHAEWRDLADGRVLVAASRVA